MSTCKQSGCFGYAKSDLCVLHKLERAEARVAELEGLLYAALPYTPDALRAAIREALGEAPETGSDDHG